MRPKTVDSLARGTSLRVETVEIRERKWAFSQPVIPGNRVMFVCRRRAAPHEGFPEPSPRINARVA